MREIVVGLMVSLDGVVEAPDQWTGPYFSDDVGATIGSLMAAGDTMLLGRETYEGFADAFGNQSGGMADQMNNTPKVVVSTTLTSADWANSTLINDNVADEIKKLKEQPGKAINMSGSATLARWLLSHGLLDRFELLVFPVVVGHGKRLFEDGGDGTALTLEGCRALESGVLHLTYRPA
jgi:dihydrofolate reductase